LLEREEDHWLEFLAGEYKENPRDLRVFRFLIARGKNALAEYGESLSKGSITPKEYMKLQRQEGRKMEKFLIHNGLATGYSKKLERKALEARQLEIIKTWNTPTEVECWDNYKELAQIVYQYVDNYFKKYVPRLSGKKLRFEDLYSGKDDIIWKAVK